jgi:hypothetical protein
MSICCCVPLLKLTPMHKHEVLITPDQKRRQRRFNVPVIGHFADRSIRFNSIIEAERITGISYTLIFEACVGKIYKARNVYWEFENGVHFIHYKAFYIRYAQKLHEEEEKEEKVHGHISEHKDLKEIMTKNP